MGIKQKINSLERLIKNPTKGLPEEAFLFASRITPIINVDLLIKNKQNQTLLTWRHDKYYGPGWHVPGGIIRYKEKISNRIRMVAAKELGAKVSFKKTPVVINELMNNARKNRGHFISLLYECELISPLDRKLEFKRGVPGPGQWAWHSKCPSNLIHAHDIYKKFL